jgi:CBS domain-containing protein
MLMHKLAITMSTSNSDEENPSNYSTVGQFMIKKVICTEGSKTLVDAAKIMIEKKIGSVLVEVEKSRFSVITKTDIIKIIADGGNPIDVKIKDVIKPPKDLITCFSSDTLEDAMLTMAKYKIERLFVVDPKDDDKIVGIISSSDLLRIAPGLLDIKREQMLLDEGEHTVAAVFAGYCDDCGNYVDQLQEIGGFAICKRCLSGRDQFTEEDNSYDNDTF